MIQHTTSRFLRLGNAEADEVAAAYQRGTAELVQTDRGRFDAAFSRVVLDSAAIMSLRPAAGYVARGCAQPGVTALFVPFRYSPDARRNGFPMVENTLYVLRPGGELLSRDRAGHPSCVIVLPTKALAAAFASLAGREMDVQREDLLPVRVTAVTFDRLQNTLMQLRGCTSNDPSLLESPEARAAMERTLLIEIALVLASDTKARRASHGGFARVEATSRVHDWLSAHENEPVYLRDLCDAAALSARGLQIVFRQVYGMSPMRYLKLRRMQMARLALLNGRAGNSVTEVAVQYGFWSFGRFSADYRTLFGERPSDTLARRGPTTAPGRLQRTESSSGWVAASHSTNSSSMSRTDRLPSWTKPAPCRPK